MMKPLPNSLARLHIIRPLASIKLIVLDIDGTLAASGASATGDLIRDLSPRLKRLEIMVTVATGRAFSGALPILKTLSNRGAPVVLYNGALVVDRAGEAIYHRVTMSSGTVIALTETARAFNAILLAYNCRPRESSILDNSGKGLEEVVTGWAKKPGPDTEINNLPISWKAYDDYDGITEANAALLAVHSGKKAAAVKQLQSLPGITTTSSGGEYIEIRPRGVTKASGLMELTKLLGLEASEVLAIGDNDNDVEMLEWAGIGVVVANATPKAIAAADFMSARDGAGGVIETLRLVQHSRRLFRDEWKTISGLEKDKKFPDTL